MFWWYLRDLIYYQESHLRLISMTVGNVTAEWVADLEPLSFLMNVSKYEDSMTARWVSRRHRYQYVMARSLTLEVKDISRRIAPLAGGVEFYAVSASSHWLH